VISRDQGSTIGQQIKQARLRRGFTQRELAEKIGVQYQQIQQYERGDRISLDRLALIAAVLDVNFTVGLKKNAMAIAVATVLGTAACFCCLPGAKAMAGELLECLAEPLGQGWHYRTKVPGFNGNVRGDRCWYDGPAMKPRAELYWPGPQAPVEMTPLPPPRPAAAQQEFHERWEGLSAR
jgi:DNA-binding XRE family transcriptional regulator